MDGAVDQLHCKSAWMTADTSLLEGMAVVAQTHFYSSRLMMQSVGCDRVSSQYALGGRLGSDSFVALALALLVKLHQFLHKTYKETEPISLRLHNHYLAHSKQI